MHYSSPLFTSYPSLPLIELFCVWNEIYTQSGKLIRLAHFQPTGLEPDAAPIVFGKVICPFMAHYCQASQASIHSLIEIAASSYEFEFGPRLINALCIIAKSFTTTTTMPETARLRDWETARPFSQRAQWECDAQTGLVVKLLQSGRCLLAGCGCK